MRLVDEVAANMSHAADICVRNAAKQEVVLDYSEGSVEILDAMIDSFWGPAGPGSESFDGMVTVLGAYLGEVMVRNLDAKWTFNAEYQTPAVLVGSRSYFPLARLAKRFREPGNGLPIFFATAKEL